MLMLISPAKTLDYVSPLAVTRHTLPLFISESARLIEICKKWTPAEIAKRMKVSDKIASLNALRFNDWSVRVTSDNARQAILAFKGDVYTGLNAQTMQASDFDWIQEHLFILSGLYGILRPLDLMQPYRLEMGTSLKNEHGPNLYSFWGERLTQTINERLQVKKEGVVLNLASNEYFKSIKPSLLKGQIITPVFKDWKNGQFKVISFFAKKARGMMVRFIIDGRIEQVEEIKSFECAGYSFCKKDSTATEWVFTRQEQ